MSSESRSRDRVIVLHGYTRGMSEEREAELSAIHLVRGPADLTDAMPPFVTAYLKHSFA